MAAYADTFCMECFADPYGYGTIYGDHGNYDHGGDLSVYDNKEGAFRQKICLLEHSVNSSYHSGFSASDGNAAFTFSAGCAGGIFPLAGGRKVLAEGELFEIRAGDRDDSAWNGRQSVN